MKTFLQIFGGTLIALSLMAMAGAGGDCDGKCGPGNDIGTMLFIVFWALVALGMGAWMFIKGSQEG
jgi:hypothetical protein